MALTAAPEALTATLYLREGSSHTVDRQQAVVRDRFEAIRTGDRLGEAAVERWPRSVVVPVADAEPASESVATFADFEAAVDAVGGSLEPFFERRARESGMLLGDAPGERLTFPVCCLALRRDGHLTGLYPHRRGGRTFSVREGLAALESGDAENLG